MDDQNWICPSAAKHFPAGLRLPIGCVRLSKPVTTFLSLNFSPKTQKDSLLRHDGTIHQGKMIFTFLPMARTLSARVRSMTSGALVRMRGAKDATSSTDFVRNIVAEDVRTGKHTTVVTRFPPEPNGYLHIGHAKAICLNFGVADEFGGIAYMRLDDTNPLKESTEYVDSILEDVTWLGGRWEDRLTHASDYFERLYLYAEELIEDGKAYVDSAPVEMVREYRGNWNIPGYDTPRVVGWG